MKLYKRSAVIGAVVLALGLPFLSPTVHAQKHTKHSVKPSSTHKKTKPVKATAKPTAAKDTSAKVWVNTKSGVYHMPGQRWYGATKEGQYMTEKEAQSHGYTHTGNGQ